MGTPFEIERGIDLRATPAEVYAVASDLARFEEWSPWAKADPGVKITVTEPSNAVGTVYRWAGKKSGEGSMTITALEADRLVAMDLVFTKPFKATNRVRFEVQPAANNHCRFVWRMQGERGLGLRIIAALMRMDRMLERQFDEGLRELRVLVDG